MQIALALLKTSGLLSEWSDRKIIPGQNIPKTIRNEMQQADIFAFLISSDFLASEACIDQWNRAKELASGSNKRLIPIILRKCAWQDFDNMSDFLALPKDGLPVKEWDSPDEAWQDVYTGIKGVIEDVLCTLSIRSEYLKSISVIEFCSQSQDQISLNDIFVFPQLYQAAADNLERSIQSADELLKLNHVLIRGDDQSGKTKLCVHVFSRLINQNKPALFVDGV